VLHALRRAWHGTERRERESGQARVDRISTKEGCLRISRLTSSDGRDWEWAAPAVIDAMAGAKLAVWLASPYGLAALGHEEGFQGTCRGTQVGGPGDRERNSSAVADKIHGIEEERRMPD